jgi:anti-anti-sigma factor
MTANTIDRQAGLCRVRLDGDLTASRVPELQALLKRELDQPIEEMVVDMTGTAMLDSSGIGLLIATFNSVGRKGGRFRIVNAAPPIFQLLQSMRLVNRLNVSGTSDVEVAHG